jgi:hypothetical protein
MMLKNIFTMSPNILAILTACILPVHSALSLDELINPGDWNGRLRMGISSMANLKVNYHGNSRQTALPSGLESTTSGISRTYDDGFVNLDNTGNHNNDTWNWGYQEVSQVITGADLIAFNSRQFSESSWKGTEDGESKGISLTWLKDPVDRNGLKISFLVSMDLLSVDSDYNKSGTADYSLTTDSYSHIGVDMSLVPAPHTGTFEGPGPIIIDSPTRTNTPGTGIAERNFELDGKLISIGSGIEIQHQLDENLFAMVQARLMMAWFDGEFNYANNYSVGGTQFASESGSMNVSETSAGGSIGAGLIWQLNDDTSIFLNGNVMLLKSLKGKQDGRGFNMDLSEGFLVTLGIQESF